MLSVIYKPFMLNVVILSVVAPINVLLANIRLASKISPGTNGLAYLLL